MVIFCNGFGFEVTKQEKGFDIYYRPASRFDNDLPIRGWLSREAFEAGGVNEFCSAIERLTPGSVKKLDRQAVALQIKQAGWITESGKF